MDRGVALVPEARSAETTFTPIGSRLRSQASRLRTIEEEQRKFRPIVYWYLSFRCNLACAHCAVASSPWVDTSTDLETEACLEVVKQLAELNVRAALLTGGEFLIRPDAMEILRALDEHGIGVGLETNGLHYPPGFTEFARKMQKHHRFSMGISLDGGTEKSHERLRGPRTFARTVRGLRYLKEERVRYVVQCVLNASNYHTIPAIYRLAQELAPECDVMQWAILNAVGRGVGLVDELGLTPDLIPRVFEAISKAKGEFEGSTIIKVPPAIVPPKYLPLVFKQPDVQAQTTCQFPLLGILPNGDVTICALSRDNVDLHFGNIREGEVRLKEIWEQTRMSALRSRYMAAENLGGICGDCIWKYACRGGCRAWAYKEGGDFDSPSPICKGLDDAGAFPKVYRFSEQNAVVAARLRQMQPACGCPA